MTTPNPGPAETPRAQVAHSADGTLVHGTSRSDRALAEILKAHGFRWSRTLGAWYLPRTWSEPTREQRVEALAATLGNEIEVARSTAPRSGAAAREADLRARAAARADRLDRRAAAAEARATAASAAIDRTLEGIPLGQPILLGHHSQRRHERDLEKIDRNHRRAIEEQANATRARDGAARARAVAARAESLVTLGNRIERTAAEIRRVRRRLDGTGQRIHGEDTPAEGTYRLRLERQLDELEDHLAHDQAKLAAAGGVSHSQDTVQPGDLVRIRGQWYPVVRANPKSVSVPGAVHAADGTRTHTAPWREVQDHLARHLAAGTSPAFPGLRRRLEQLAEALPEGTPRGAGE